MFSALSGHPALRTRYHYALYLEPDALPVRGNFLAAVEELAWWALAERKMTVQSGCSANASAPRSFWRNGSPALYRLGDEASRFFRGCFDSYACNPWQDPCSYAWDMYLWVCFGGQYHPTREIGITCAFHHAGSAWVSNRGSVAWESLRELPFIDEVYLLHSVYVIDRVAVIVDDLEQEIEAEESGHRTLESDTRQLA
eukprot:ctg_1126.g434